ncbi:hypothetical protein B5X24_HaOG214596 [Helicoverpa armigera]|uniref:Uncharacterized protein n=1 Tax=Helicoverpa armigera TaxID=29058 RepID=A0A2W1B6X6_HELAM|nr:hypothetical protein B5X24_HaOG214596 [Helicoverpa armigera]
MASNRALFVKWIRSGKYLFGYLQQRFKQHRKISCIETQRMLSTVTFQFSAYDNYLSCPQYFTPISTYNADPTTRI